MADLQHRPERRITVTARWWSDLGPDEPIDVGSATGVAPAHVTLVLRDEFDGDYTTAKIIMEAFGDPAIDVRRDGVVGWGQVRATMERFFGEPISERWVRKLVRRDETMRYVGRVPGTTIERLETHLGAHVASRHASPRNAALERWSRLEALVTNTGSAGRRDAFRRVP